VAEVSGANVDNKTKLELLKQEQAQIKLENEAKVEEAVAAAAATVVTESPVPSMKPEKIAEPMSPEKDFAAAQAAKEKLVDKATVLSPETEMISAVEIKEINQLIENLPASSSKQVKAEIDELKKDVSEYQEDVKEIEQMTQASDSKSKLTETKSAKLLSKRVSKLLSDVDTLVVKLEKESSKTAPSTDKAHHNTVSIQELIETIKRLKGISTQDKEKKLVQILQSLDKDKDGRIDDINDVLKVKNKLAVLFCLQAF
jgi:LETM1 and EF-hand domain-containing protein 1